LEEEKMKRELSILFFIALLIIFYIVSIGEKGYQRDFQKPTSSCSVQACEESSCEPLEIHRVNEININCKLIPLDCKCKIYNYNLFYESLGKDSIVYNPSANIYKSYEDLIKFVDGQAQTTSPMLTVTFIEKEMQYYSKGNIYVWPNDKYGQYHEMIHFLLRQYTQPQEGWYPYMEEGLAHYGAYCYNNPNTARCNYDLGNYADSDICVPNLGSCTGQIMDTSLVLQLRRDYGCDWNHCWKQFLKWAVEEKKGQPLTLKDATNELNSIIGKDIRPLLLSYNINEKDYLQQPQFSIYYEDKVEEESIINNNGEFTTI
jgi:hypothetical protein